MPPGDRHQEGGMLIKSEREGDCDEHEGALGRRYVSFSPTDVHTAGIRAQKRTRRWRCQNIRNEGGGVGEGANGGGDVSMASGAIGFPPGCIAVYRREESRMGRLVRG